MDDRPQYEESDVMHQPDEREMRVLYAAKAALERARQLSSTARPNAAHSITDAEVITELPDSVFDDQEVREVLAVLAKDWLDCRVERSSDGSVSGVVIHGMDPSRIEEGDI